MKKNSQEVNWSEELEAAVTVCDLEGIIVYMNRKSIEQFKDYGGEKLLGTNLLDCHPEPSKSTLKKMLARPVNNMYCIQRKEKKFVK